MKKKDLEQLGLIYEFMNNSYGGESADDSDERPDDEGDDEGDDNFDYDNSPYKNAVFDKSNPKSDKAYRQLVDDMYAKNVITLERFWNLFSVMYGMHPVKDAPPFKEWKTSLRHAVNKVQRDFEMPVDIDLKGHGSVYLVD